MSPRVRPKRRPADAVREAQRQALLRGVTPRSVLAEDPDAIFRRAVSAHQLDRPLSPTPYGGESSHSWFADVAWQSVTAETLRGLPPPPNMIGSPQQAELRLRTASVLEQRSHRKREQRDLTTTATAGGSFVPPAHIAEAFAEGIRATAVLTDVLPTEPLPEKGMVLTTPRITTPASAAVQDPQNSGLSETDVVEALVASPVATVETMQDLSQQLFDRSEPGAAAGADMWIARELGKALGFRRDQQLLDGTAANGQTRGLTQVASIGTTAYTDATPTQSEAFPGSSRRPPSWPPAAAGPRRRPSSSTRAGWPGSPTGRTPRTVSRRPSPGRPRSSRSPPSRQPEGRARTRTTCWCCDARSCRSTSRHLSSGRARRSSLEC